MARLTDKEKCNGNYTCKIENITDVINKCGAIEDIEEKFGIDLFTLLKCLKAEKFYVKYAGKIAKWEEDIYGNIVWDIPNDFVYFYWSEPIEFAHLVLEISDYGKTWALEKGELE